jgi:hypothetical protein
VRTSTARCASVRAQPAAQRQWRTRARSAPAAAPAWRRHAARHGVDCETLTRTPLVEEYLYVFGFLMPARQHGGRRVSASPTCNGEPASAARGVRARHFAKTLQHQGGKRTPGSAPFLCALLDWL